MITHVIMLTAYNYLLYILVNDSHGYNLSPSSPLPALKVFLFVPYLCFLQFHIQAKLSAHSLTLQLVSVSVIGDFTLLLVVQASKSLVYLVSNSISI